MKQISWNEYYSKFYDLAPSTQKSYSYRLSNFGEADEVFEVLQEFVFYDESFSSRFAAKAMNAGVHFTPDQVNEMILFLETPVLERMAETSDPVYNEEQLDELYTHVSDAVFNRIVKKSGVDFFEKENAIYEEYDELDLYDEIINEYAYTKPKRHTSGFLAGLFALLAGLGSSGKKKHSGRCDGDCANCPPHYGYRYGRWYYGHDHAHGCEFGGNKCSGNMD